MEHAIAKLAHDAIADRCFPGCVVGIFHDGTSKILAHGQETYSSDSPEVRERSLYDLASITKVIPTATLALQFLDEGKLYLDDLLITYIPEYRTRDRDRVTIQHLFTYTLGNRLPLSHAGTTPEEIFESVCTEDTVPPGTVFNYSNTPAFLLGLVLERIGGSLAKQADALFEEFGMRSATFAPRGAVPSEEGIQDIVHDESARIFSRAQRIVGHAGLFASAPDLLSFLSHLLKHPDQRLMTNQIPHLNASVALGWELDQAWMGTQRTARTFGKTGFTGTSLLGDCDRNIGIVILSNRTYPKRPENKSAIDAFRKGVCDIVFS